jgi:hypothetical protein
MNIFIGTEFTAMKVGQLISLGMVCENGDDFYAEVRYSTPLDSKLASSLPTDWKIAHAPVDPDRVYETAIELMEGARKPDEDVFICAESEIDWLLFCAALSGRVPSWCHPRYIGHEIVVSLRDQYKPRFFDLYALIRAKANRHAYRPATPKKLKRVNE